MALDLTGLSQEEAFAKAAQYAGVDESVMRGIWRTESQNGNPKFMRSAAGARGHFGLMPQTQATWEEREGRKFDPDDFNDSLTVAALTMQENVKHFDGNVPDALRGYNNGWDRSRWNNPETQAYAGKVLGATDADTVSGTSRLDLTGRIGPSPEEVWTTSAYDLAQNMQKEAAGGVRKDYLSDVEKGVIAQGGIEAAVAAVVSGKTDAAPDASLTARQTITPQVREVAPQVIENLGARPSGQDTNEIGWQATIDNAQFVESEQAKVDAITAGDRFKAAWQGNTMSAGIMSWIDQQYQQTPNDPTFDYMKNIDKIELDRSEDEISELREQANSDLQVQIIRNRQDGIREQERTLTAGAGTGTVLMYSLAGGVADPAGWLATAGIGKAMQMVGIGSRVLFAERQTAAAFAAAGVEGAVGNVAVTAALDAAGHHMSTADYAVAAGFGLVMGAGFGALEWRGASRAAAQAELETLADSISTAAAVKNADLYERAMGEAGAGATPEQIAARATEIEQRDGDQLLELAFGRTKDEDMMFPRPPAGENPAGAVSGSRFLPGSLVNTEAKYKAIQTKYGLDVSIADDAERKLAAETYARAERILANNPIQAERLNTLLAKAGWEATSTRLLASQNPVLKAFAVIALENPEGAAGRRVTASMTKAMRERAYVGNTLNDYENAYAVWRNRRGESAVKDFYDSKARREFDRQVYAERDRRWQGKNVGPVEPEVTLASDILDRGYNGMLRDQRFVGTIGAARLPVGDVKGYQPRRMAAGVVGGLNDAQRKAVVKGLSQEFQDSAGFDSDFADKFARLYLERANTQAKGAWDVPANLHDTDSADIMRDSLKALSMTDEQIERTMERFTRGGAAHTKSRIDMDLTTLYPDEQGGNLQLMDIMNTDNLSLFRQYARRVSGEAALTNYGVMGEQGLKQLRVAAQVGPDGMRATPKDLEAFDQVAAEFLGKPFGNQLGKWADNARSFTSALRLGGMGFNQFNEYANGVASVGVMRSFKAIAALPRLMGEVRAMKAGKPAKNSLLGSMELYGGDFGMEGYRMQGMYDVNAGFEVYGQEAINVFDKAVRAGAHANRILSFHRALTAVQVRGMAEQIIMKSGRYIRDGVEDAALREMGMTPEVVAAVRKDLSKAYKFGPNGEVAEFDITKISDTNAAHAYMQSIWRGAHQIIQETYIGESAKWAHDGWLKLLTQFRGYGLTAVQKQWRRQQYTHGTAKALGYLMGSMSVAIPIHMARVQLRALGHADREKFLDRELSPLAFGRSTMNYISSVGVLPDVLDIASGLTGGTITGGRAGNQSFVGGQILPVAGVANDIYQAAASRDPHKVVKLLPGSNIPYLQVAVNQLDE